MSRLKDQICRARWFANRGRYGEAVATLEGVRHPDDYDVYDVVHYYGFRGGFRLQASTGMEPVIDDLCHSLILAHTNSMPDNLFVWLVRYNLGLALALQNHPLLGMPGPEQHKKLVEAVDILGTTAEALRTMHVLPNQQLRSGTALALVAEVLFILWRPTEAGFYATEAIPRLTPHTHIEPVTRRLHGCYGIVRSVYEGWSAADRTRYLLAGMLPPGEIKRDEADNYRTVPQPPGTAAG